MVFTTEDERTLGKIVGVEDCFLCGCSIETLPCIQWHGNDKNATNIYLHHDCDVTLAAHMQSDFTRLLIGEAQKRRV